MAEDREAWLSVADIGVSTTLKKSEAVDVLLLSLCAMFGSLVVGKCVSFKSDK